MYIPYFNVIYIPFSFCSFSSFLFVFKIVIGWRTVTDPTRDGFGVGEMSWVGQQLTEMESTERDCRHHNP